MVRNRPHDALATGDRHHAPVGKCPRRFGGPDEGSNQVETSKALAREHRELPSARAAGRPQKRWSSDTGAIERLLGNCGYFDFAAL
jgi:hypothetical protein